MNFKHFFSRKTFILCIFGVVIILDYVFDLDKQTSLETFFLLCVLYISSELYDIYCVQNCTQKELYQVKEEIKGLKEEISDISKFLEHKKLK